MAKALSQFTLLNTPSGACLQTPSRIIQRKFADPVVANDGAMGTIGVGAGFVVHLVIS
jgi:hypothetical protein